MCIRAITVLVMLTAKWQKLFYKSEKYTMSAFKGISDRDREIDERNFVWERRLKSCENGVLYD